MRAKLVVGALVLAPLIAFATAFAAQPQPVAAEPKAPRMASDDVMAKLEKGEIFFLDVREPKELEELGTLEGYVNIPLGEIEKRLAEIPRDRPIVTA